jgi:hypothetical protein
MVRSYEVDFSVIDNKAGFMLYCFEDEDCVWEQFFVDSSYAHAMGSRFLDGCYIKGVPVEEFV